MFKNLTIYRIGPAWAAHSGHAEDGLARAAFVECGLSQPMSSGWVPPRGQAHGRLLEVVAGQWHMTLQVEQRILPASVVRRHVEAQAERIEQETGRAPGKRQRRDLKDAATLELLPRAFTKQSRVKIWIDPVRRWLMMDATSVSRADMVITHLVQVFDGLTLTPLQSTLAPDTAMASWLRDGDAPSGFSIDRECELRSPDETKALVRYARHPLDTAEVRAHVEAGMRPTRLALTWEGRVSVVLTEALQLRKIGFLEGVFEATASKEDDAFDADAALATGELARLLPDLLEALGGELEHAAPAQAA